MSKQATIRQLIQEELAYGPPRDFPSRLEDRIHCFIRTFTGLYIKLAADAQDFHTAREIQKLEDRLLLSPAPTETWTEKNGEAS